MGPILKQYLLSRVRQSIRQKDSSVGFIESFQLANSLTDEQFRFAKQMAAQKLNMTMGAVDAAIEAGGEHPVLDWLTEFLNSDLGKALIQILTALLLGLL